MLTEIYDEEEVNAGFYVFEVTIGFSLETETVGNYHRLVQNKEHAYHIPSYLEL